MLVISSSVRMLNGIQRTTSDLRPATSFHFVLVKMAPALKTGLSVVIGHALVPLRNSCPLQGQTLVEPAGTYSGTVPASRIQTRCGCFTRSSAICNGYSTCASASPPGSVD